MRKVQHALVAFGANLQLAVRPPAEVLPQAARVLADTPLTILAMSRLYSSPCFPVGAGPDYVNATALIETELTPEALLRRLHAVEAAFGRQRVQRWGQRTLDLDLLACGDLVLPDAATQDHWRALAPDQQAKAAPQELILPHPRLQDRAFVLVPLADIAPDWRHPRLGLTVLQMLGRLKKAEIDAVRPL